MRASPLLLLCALALARAAEVFVIADTQNQTAALAAAANRTIAEAGSLADDDPLADSDREPVVRKKRTFGDIVFRGLADVLGYNVARKAPQVVFPPPLAPVPGIDAPLRVTVPRLETPLQAIPLAVLPIVAAAQAGIAAANPCSQSAGSQGCRTQAAAKPPPLPCPGLITIATPKLQAQASPCGAAASSCDPAASDPAKSDANLEKITSNFRLDFNFNRGPATNAPAAQAQAAPDQPAEQEQKPQQKTEPKKKEEEQKVTVAPVPIRPQAGKLPPEPPRNPRVYLDAFVVRNGVTQKVQTIDAQHLNRHQADNDYLVYDDGEETQAAQEQEDEDDDYDYIQESRERTKSIREFGTAVDQFWDQKKNKKKKLPVYDYRYVHFGDRDLANQFLEDNDETHQSLQLKEPAPSPQRQQYPILDDEDETTTTTQDPRRRLKPRILPPTEKNPNQIDTVTVRVPPIYKEKHPKKLHRERTERPNSEEDTERPFEYSYHGPEENNHSDDAQSENSEPVYQTEKPKRKRRRKNRRKTRSIQSQHYTAGDFDYYGKKLPISKEEEYFRGLTIPPPTKDADLARLELAPDGEGHFLDDHERLQDESERIKTKRKNGGKKNSDDKGSEGERSEESEPSNEKRNESERLEAGESSQDDAERSGEKERAEESERSDRLSPNARVRETGYQNNYVHAHNVQVDDNQPLVRTVKRKKPKIDKNA